MQASPIPANCTIPVTKELSNIKVDVGHIGNSVKCLEKAQKAVLSHSEATQNDSQAWQEHLNSALLMLEDQENHNCRKNRRLRGIPVNVAHEAMQTVHEAMQTGILFSSLLVPECTNKINIKIIHRELILKPMAADPTRDVLLQKAREMPNISFEGVKVLLFQELSASTLTERRILKPLKDAPKEKRSPVHSPYSSGLDPE